MSVKREGDRERYVNQIIHSTETARLCVLHNVFIMTTENVDNITEQ